MNFVLTRWRRLARPMCALTALTLLAGTIHAAPPGVRHVRADAPAGGDGLSWATAYNDLREALITAEASGGAVTELWVKERTYLPGPAGSTDRTRNFTLVDGVGVYGGFAGVESARADRNPHSRPTILNGRLSPSVAVYNVVIGPGDAGTILEGFTITGGAASTQRRTTTTTWAGGALFITGSPTIRSCLILQNSCGGMSLTDAGLKMGGGVYCAPGSGATFIDCILRQNTTVLALSGVSGHGGGLAAEDCALTMIGCTVEENLASGSSYGPCGGGISSQSTPGHGGGIYAAGCAIVLDGCTIRQNQTGNGGGGVHGCGSGAMGITPGLDAGRGGGIYSSESVVVAVNCQFTGNITGSGGAGLTTGDGERGSAGGDGGDGSAVYATAGEIELINCTLARNHLGVMGVAGFGSVSSGTDGIAGRGSLYGDGAALTNCIVWNEGAPELVGAIDAAYCDVRGGHAGPGNIDADPVFIDVTVGNFRLGSVSPCIDAGDSLVNIDPFAPGTQPLPQVDRDGQARRVDVAAIADTGIGAPVVDIGAFEVQNPCVADLTGDGLVDFSDYLAYINYYEVGDVRADLDHDWIIEFSDYLEFLNLYDAGC